MSFGNTYVSRSITVNGALDPDHSTGVLYDPVTKTLKFVPTVFEAQGGSTAAAMLRATAAASMGAVARESPLYQRIR